MSHETSPQSRKAQGPFQEEERSSSVLRVGPTSPSSLRPIQGRVVRVTVRVALDSIAARFSDDAPKIDVLHSALRERYTALEAWPADGQLGLYVLAWALGSGFNLKGFKERMNALVPDFAGGAKAIGQGATPTLITLGAIARCAFGNAAVVLRWDLDPEILYWPTNLSGTVGATLT